MTPEIKQRIEQIRQGEIPEEYQKKSVGIIPKNWNKSFLGAIIKELSSGVSVNSDVTIDTGVYVLKTSSIAAILELSSSISFSLICFALIDEMYLPVSPKSPSSSFIPISLAIMLSSARGAFIIPISSKQLLCLADENM